MIRVVVPERVRGRPGRMRALPERGVGQGVEVDRCAGVRDGLQQTNVGGVARLADEAILLADPVGQRHFQRARRVLLKQESPRLDHELRAARHRLDLRRDDGRMPGDVQVVVAVQTHGVGPGRAPMQNESPSPGVSPSGREFAPDAGLQRSGQGRIDRGRFADGLKRFHRDLL
ncbi:hypothetical protein FQZ97_932330 [compost metagenome]